MIYQVKCTNHKQNILKKESLNSDDDQFPKNWFSPQNISTIIDWWINVFFMPCVLADTGKICFRPYNHIRVTFKSDYAYYYSIT